MDRESIDRAINFLSSNQKSASTFFIGIMSVTGRVDIQSVGNLVELSFIKFILEQYMEKTLQTEGREGILKIT